MDFTISQQIHMDSNGFMLNCSDYIKWTLQQHQNTHGITWSNAKL
jgi:putative component of membrane protein insertase Oxa1/YidC/SpoIIIJ protein YidD